MIKKHFILTQSGATIVELLLVMGLTATFAGFIVINLIRPQTQASIDSTVTTLIADLKAQQLKAIQGNSGNQSTSQQYGIKFLSSTYILYKGNTYNAGDTENFTVTNDTAISFSTTFSSQEVNFKKISGEVNGFVNGSNTITVTNTNSGDSKVITINRYGVLSVN